MEKKIETNKGVFTMTQSITGYWRLEDEDGNMVHDDPACDDVYVKEIAYAFFMQLIDEL